MSLCALLVAVLMCRAVVSPIREMRVIAAFIAPYVHGGHAVSDAIRIPSFAQSKGADVKRWEVLTVSCRDGKFYMEMVDGDFYHLAPVSEEDAAYLQASLDAGNHIYATEL